MKVVEAGVEDAEGAEGVAEGIVGGVVGVVAEETTRFD